MENNRDGIEAELHRVGVHDGWPTQRRAMAVALDLHGITAADVALVVAAVERQRRRDSDSVPAIVAKLLRDPKEAVDRIADMRKGQNARDAHAATPAPYPGAGPLWRRGIDWTEADRVRDRRVAYAIIVVDRKPAREAAEFLGVSESEAVQLAEQHAVERKSWKLDNLQRGQKNL